MSDEQDHPEESIDRSDAEVIGAVEGGVRVFWVTGATMQDLVNRLALILAEHMTDGDELHVTYNAMQNGWQHHPPTARTLMKPPKPEWTELFFEYSAFVVLRQLTAEASSS